MKYILSITKIIIAFILFMFSTAVFAQVGINMGATSPTTTMDLNGALSLRESPSSLILTNAANQNIDLGTTPYSQYRVEGPTSSFSINQISRVGTLADGQIVRLINNTDQVMTLVHSNFNDGLRITCPGEINLLLPGKYSSVTLQYSKFLERWTVLGYDQTSIRNNNQYVVPAGPDISKNNSDWTPVAGLTQTITPVNSTIYITYVINGRTEGSNLFNPIQGLFRLMANGVEVPNTQIKTEEIRFDSDFIGELPMYPYDVTPGTPITFTVEWARSGTGTIYNEIVSNTAHHRHLVIVD